MSKTPSFIELSINLSRIIEKPGFNPRLDFGENDGTFAGLVESIRERGMIQAPRLTPVAAPPSYTYANAHEHEYWDKCDWYIVSGHRRIAAARALGWERVDCSCLFWESPEDIARYAEEDQLVDALVENLQRKKLNCIEAASGFKRLEDMGRTQEQIAKLVGSSQGRVSRLVRLLNLPVGVVTLLREGTLEQTYGEELLPLLGSGLLAGEIEALARKAVETGLTSQGLSNVVRDRLKALEPAKTRAGQQSIFDEDEEQEGRQERSVGGMVAEAASGLFGAHNPRSSNNAQGTTDSGVQKLNVPSKDTNDLTRKDSDSQFASAMAPDPDVTPLSSLPSVDLPAAPALGVPESLGDEVQRVFGWLDENRVPVDTALRLLKRIVGEGRYLREALDKPGLWIRLDPEVGVTLMSLADTPAYSGKTIDELAAAVVLERAIALGIDPAPPAMPPAVSQNTAVPAAGPELDDIDLEAVLAPTLEEELRTLLAPCVLNEEPRLSESGGGVSSRCTRLPEMLNDFMDLQRSTMADGRWEFALAVVRADLAHLIARQWTGQSTRRRVFELAQAITCKYPPDFSKAMELLPEFAEHMKAKATTKNLRAGLKTWQVPLSDPTQARLKAQGMEQTERERADQAAAAQRRADRAAAHEKRKAESRQRGIERGISSDSAPASSIYIDEAGNSPLRIIIPSRQGALGRNKCWESLLVQGNYLWGHLDEKDKDVRPRAEIGTVIAPLWHDGLMYATTYFYSGSGIKPSRKWGWVMIPIEDYEDQPLGRDLPAPHDDPDLWIEKPRNPSKFVESVGNYNFDGAVVRWNGELYVLAAPYVELISDEDAERFGVVGEPLNWTGPEGPDWDKKPRGRKKLVHQANSPSQIAPEEVDEKSLQTEESSTEPETPSQTTLETVDENIPDAEEPSTAELDEEPEAKGPKWTEAHTAFCDAVLAAGKGDYLTLEYICPSFVASGRLARLVLYGDTVGSMAKSSDPVRGDALFVKALEDLPLWLAHLEAGGIAGRSRGPAKRDKLRALWGGSLCGGTLVNGTKYGFGWSEWVGGVGGKWEQRGTWDFGTNPPPPAESLEQARMRALELSQKQIYHLFHVSVVTDEDGFHSERGDLWYYRGQVVPGDNRDRTPSEADLRYVGAWNSFGPQEELRAAQGDQDNLTDEQWEASARRPLVSLDIEPAQDLMSQAGSFADQLVGVPQGGGK